MKRALGGCLIFLACCSPCQAEKPNIVLILADDMGYGDPQCFNPDSRCQTPNIDSLARAGLCLTDAHATGLCIPSRYSLMTGRYPFRGDLQPNREAVIEPQRSTVATLLQDQGYATHMVGKWHLGFDGGIRFDYSAPLTGGPVDRGFESFFGMHASLDIPPYFYVRDRQATEPASGHIEASSTPGWSPIQGAFWRSGPIASDFHHSEVLDRFATEAVSVVEQQSADGPPFFLYVALPAPHTPWLPDPRFRNKGEAGLYGEFVAHVDDVVGRILRSLEERQLVSETLVIFASDNGPTWYERDAEKFDHRSAGPWRGMKADAWEGGHRIPFIVRWPGRVPEGTRSDALIGFVDLYATFADLVEVPVSPGAGEDSISFLPVLRDPQTPGSRTMLSPHQDGTTLRSGPWKLITHLGSGGFTQPRNVPPEPGGPTGQLYHLGDDPAESTNLWMERPDVVQRLTAELEALKAGKQASADTPGSTKSTSPNQ